MKAISAALIVISGSIALLTGMIADRGDRDMPTALGLALIVIGTAAWISEMWKGREG